MSERVSFNCLQFSRAGNNRWVFVMVMIRVVVCSSFCNHFFGWRLFNRFFSNRFFGSYFFGTGIVKMVTGVVSALPTISTADLPFALDAATGADDLVAAILAIISALLGMLDFVVVCFLRTAVFLAAGRTT